MGGALNCCLEVEAEANWTIPVRDRKINFHVENSPRNSPRNPLKHDL